MTAVLPDLIDLSSDNDGLLDTAESGDTGAYPDGDGMTDCDVDCRGNPLKKSGSATDTNCDVVPDTQEPNGNGFSTDTD